MLHWFQKQLISEESAAWIGDTAAWALTLMGPDNFADHIQLVQPDSTHFPEKIQGIDALARYVLTRVSELAGVGHWPWQLVDARLATTAPPPLLLSAPENLPAQTLAAPTGSALQVPFVVDQVAKPQDMVATIAHTCAQHLLFQSQSTPPGGMQYFEQAAEVLAVFMGFGVMLANSAYTFRGSCARCYNPRANRQASLSEAESVYALALFAHMKHIPREQVFKHLKPHLKTSYKIALKQIKNRAPAG